MSDLLASILANVGEPEAVNAPEAEAIVRPHVTLPAWPTPTIEGGFDLYPFQSAALDHILSSPVGRRTFLSLQQGMGKTPISIHAVAASLASGPQNAGPVLVVVPPSLRRTWLREFHNFRPGTTIHLLTGRTVSEAPLDVEVLLVGDSVLAAWADELTGKVSGLVIDECQRMKSLSQRSNAALQIARHLPQDGLRLLLTGTLTTNGRPAELTQSLSILDRLGEAVPKQDGTTGFGTIGKKGVDANVFRFLNTFAPKVKGDRFGRRGVADLDVLHRNLVDNVGMYRRLRSDVPELENLNKARNVWFAEMNNREARLYREAEDDLRSFLTGRWGRSGAQADKTMKVEALAKLNVLRTLAGQGKVKAIVERTKEILAADPNERVFIATWFTSEAKALKEAFGEKAVLITGAQSDTQKDEAQRRFTTDDEDSVPILIGNIIAAGTGLTLHGGGKCRTIIVGSAPWTPSDLEQVEDRLCRIGQTRDVHSIVAVAAFTDGGLESIDEVVYNLLTFKKEATSMIHDGIVSDGLWSDSAFTDELIGHYSN
jgi:SNF2 family DNA or RNA helicase